MPYKTQRASVLDNKLVRKNSLTETLHLCVHIAKFPGKPGYQDPHGNKMKSSCM